MAAEISSTHVAMKEAFVRYDDGIPWNRDLKIMDIMEDMQILDNMDKKMNSNINKKPLILKIKRRR